MRYRAFIYLSGLMMLASCSDEPPRLKLETAMIRVKDHAAAVELARSPEEQARGLMFRRSLERNDGMLFIYDSPRIMSFWMKNTRIRLSIAFIRSDWSIAQIEDMDPYDEINRTVSSELVQFALEMNQGWFRENGVGVGDVITAESKK